ncbi:hypothetical protein [Anaerosporobacter faecicola]|uniref:hypothetical protein n=1 Tax=Anaerosporobacter faecicola TaxID=2718714 RepID=UPI0014393BD0|nr:hypothetical protein [Anaerosporobacter faecicola]
MKKISLILAVTMFLILPTTKVCAMDSNVGSDNTDGSIYMSAEEKMNFKSTNDQKFQNDMIEGRAKEYNKDYVESLMLEAAIESTENITDIYSELETYGCYVMNPIETDNNKSIKSFASSDSSDVSLSTPTVYYNAYNNTWTVTCGGYWKTTNWQKDFLTTGNVGGQDGFGVGFTNTSGSYKSAVVSCSAFITDDKGTYVSTSNRSDGDGSKGFGFRLQDYVRTTGLYNYYIGYKWSGLCNYDTWFGNYSGIATAYYIHTYKSASISSVSFGVDGKNAGINASISNESNSFQCFSNDKKFGVQ